MAQQFDPDLYTKLFNLTKPYHRDLYPALAPTNPQNSASGKIVLITGASRGLGRAIARSWAEAGADGIVVTSRKIEDLEGVTNDVKKASEEKTQVLAVAAEITKPTDVKNVFDQAKEKFGKMDVVIAQAGIMTSNAKIGEHDPEEWWNEQEINVRGVHLSAHYFIKTFGPKGTFVTMTSGAAGFVLPGMASYGMSKRGCIDIVEYLHAEYPEIRAFSVNPGIVKGVADAPDFVPFALDAPELVGAFMVWLSTARADCVRGGYVGVNWDIEELERHGKEIQEKGLLKEKFLCGILGPEGYEFGK